MAHKFKNIIIDTTVNEAFFILEDELGQEYAYDKQMLKKMIRKKVLVVSNLKMNWLGKLIVVKE